MKLILPPEVLTAQFPLPELFVRFIGTSRRDGRPHAAATAEPYGATRWRFDR